jgi:DZF domain
MHVLLEDAVSHNCHRNELILSTDLLVSLQALELIVERCLSRSNGPLSPALALRRVFECIASGLLLPGNSLCFRSMF